MSDPSQPADQIRKAVRVAGEAMPGQPTSSDLVRYLSGCLSQTRSTSLLRWVTSSVEAGDELLRVHSELNRLQTSPLEAALADESEIGREWAAIVKERVLAASRLRLEGTPVLSDSL